MAKKSAKSKGFRKTTGKKPYLSKRDIIVLCVVLAVLAAGAVLLFSYNDGALKTKGGRIVDAGENWLIVNGSASSGGKRYYKLAEIGEIDGYTREIEPMLSDDNLNLFNFRAEDETAPVQSITISANHAGAQRLAEYYSSLIGSIGEPVLGSDSVGDVGYSYFTYTSAYYSEDAQEDAQAADAVASEAAEGDEEAAAEAEAADDAEEAAVEAEATDGAEEADAEAAGEDETPPPNRFNQYLHAYFDAAHDSSASVAIEVDAASADDYLSDDALKEVLAQAVAAITFEAE